MLTFICTILHLEVQLKCLILLKYIANNIASDNGGVVDHKFGCPNLCSLI